MLLRKSLFICFATVTLCLVGTTLGKAVRQELMWEEETVVGQAILGYAMGIDMTICQVNCWDLAPEEEYIVLLFECAEEGYVIGSYTLDSFTTNKIGIGYLNTVIEGDFSDCCVVVAFLDTDGKVIPLCVPIDLPLQTAIDYLYLYVWP